MKKVALAALLGLVGFPLFMFFGEAWGMVAGFAALAVFVYVFQFLLSKGNPHALWRDWRIMLALNAVMLISVVIMSLVEDVRVVVSQGLGILLSLAAGTLAGAWTAAHTARSSPKRG